MRRYRIVMLVLTVLGGTSVQAAQLIGGTTKGIANFNPPDIQYPLSKKATWPEDWYALYKRKGTWSLAPTKVMTAANSGGKTAKPTAPVQTRYDAVMSVCKFVASSDRPNFVSRFNVVTPGSGVGHYFHARAIGIDANAKWKTTLLEGPSHGRLQSEGYVAGVYHYYPNEGYIGLDQIIFAFDVQGKKIKVILSVWADPDAPDSMHKSTHPEAYKLCPSGYGVKEVPNPIPGGQGSAFDIKEINLDAPLAVAPIQ